MRHLQRVLISLVAIGFLSTAAMVVQNPDPFSNIDGFVTLGGAKRVNAAATGVQVDRQNYAGAMVSINSNRITQTAGARVYAVLQDSSVTPAQVWTAVDSVLVDTITNSHYKIAYRSNKRFLRVVLRAAGSTSDTTMVAITVLLTGKRSK